MPGDHTGHAKRAIKELLLAPVAVGLVVYFVTEPYLHGALAGATGVIVGELAANVIVTIAYTLLLAFFNFLSRRLAAAFIVFSFVSFWSVKALLDHYGCAPRYVALGAIGGMPILAFYLVLLLMLARHKTNDAKDEEEAEEPDYSAFGIGSALEGIGKAARLLWAVVLWLVTVIYGCLLLFVVVHWGLGLTSLRSASLSFVLLTAFTLVDVFAIRVALERR